MLAISTFVLPLAFAVFATVAAPATTPGTPGTPEATRVRIAAKGKAKSKAPAAEAAAPEGEPAAEEAVVDGDAPAAPDREVKYHGAELGTTIGGATGFVFKRGFYAQSDLGGFIRFGGWNDGADPCQRCREVVTSLTQPYIGIGVGYDFFDWFGLQLTLAQGFVASAAPFGSVKGGSTDSPRDYGITYLNVGATFSWYFFDRLAAAVKVFGGGSFLSPAPDVINGVPVPFAGGDFGAGVGIRYATLLTDVSVGLDVNFFGSVSPDGSGGALFIPALSFAPVIKYTF